MKRNANEHKKIPKNENKLGMMEWKKHVSPNQHVRVTVLTAHKEKINMRPFGKHYTTSDQMLDVLEVFND